MEVSANKFFPLIRNLLADSAKDTNGDYKQERYSDDLLLIYFQDTLFSLSIIDPYIFSKYIDYEIEEENVLQKLPENMVEIIDIHAVNGSKAIKEAGKTLMDSRSPDWLNTTAQEPRQWMRDKRSKDIFFLYPTPKKGTILTMQCVYVPLLDSKNTLFNFNIQYQPVLVQKVVSMALSSESEPQSQERGISLFDLMAKNHFSYDELSEKKKSEDKN